MRQAIQEGSLRAGVTLPASRRLAAQLGVSRGVVSDAYAQLETQGFLQMLPRRAPVVLATPGRRRSLAPSPPAVPPRFDMTPTTPEVTLFPRRRWSSELTAAIREAPTAALRYGDPCGDLSLREELADELGRTRGVVCEPAQIIVVQGAAQGLDLALRTLRRAGAARIAVEDPSLRRQHDQVRDLNLGLIGRPVDREGIVLDRLDADADADAIVVSPAHQFPTGVVLSGRRRRQLIEWSLETGGLVIEDDYDAEFRFDREPVRALQGLHPEGVVYLGTTSKTLAPALRIGWVVVPVRLVEPFTRAKRLLDDFSPTLEQIAFARMLRHGHYQRHVRRARRIYRGRRDLLVAALGQQFPGCRVSGIAAGLNVTLELPSGVDDRELERIALDAGVRVEALTRHVIDVRDRRGLLIGYGPVHESAIAPAIAALGAALRPTLREWLPGS